MGESRMLDAALAYARMGLAVFPLKPCDKVPAVTNGNKSATTDLEAVEEAWTVKPECNIGIATGAVSGGLVVIDVDVDDDEDGYHTLKAWEDEHGALPETATCITGTNGMHLYYRTDRPLRNSAGGKALGIDIRADGGHVVAPPSIHPNGREYEFEQYLSDLPIAEADENVLAFIEYIQGQRRGRKFELPDKAEEGKRNDTVFRFGCSLQEKGYEDGVLIATMHTYNQRNCNPPLPAPEMDKIIESVLSNYPKGRNKFEGTTSNIKTPPFRKLDKNGNPTGGILHHVVGQELIDNHKACFVDGAPAVWNGRRYETGWDGINRAILDLVEDCKMKDQNEIRHYIHLRAPKVKASEPFLIAFENGVLDIDYGLRDYSEDMVITNVIPHNYVKDAYDEASDMFLDRISCHNYVVRQNLEEVIGLCLYRANDFGQCPVLIGYGSNGKSTYIAALRNVLGIENVSSLDINTVGKNFQAGRLLGKLANLGDDISNERLNGDILAIFKKIVTGDWIYTDVKYAEGLEFKPYCTMVFSCNEFPSLGDSSDGMMRRLFPIPFDASFQKTDSDYDPRIKEKLTTENAAQYLIRLGIEGLQRIRVNRGLTPNKRSQAMVYEVKADNDNILQWIDDQSIEKKEDLENKVISEVFSRYQEWCELSGLRSFSKTKFTQKINKHFKLKSVTAKCDFSDGKRNARVFRACK